MRERLFDWLWSWLAPQNFASFLLFVVGTAGVIIGVCTLFHLKRQTATAIKALIANRRATNAARDAAAAAANTLATNQ